jgi:hypothetical protein
MSGDPWRQNQPAQAAVNTGSCHLTVNRQPDASQMIRKLLGISLVSLLASTMLAAQQGKPLSAEDAELIRSFPGIDEIRSTDVLLEHLAQRTASPAVRTVYTPFSPPEPQSTTRGQASRTYGDIARDPLDGRPPREEQFRTQLGQRLRGFEVRDLSPILDSIRLIKSPREIERIEAVMREPGLLQRHPRLFPTPALAGPPAYP